MIKISKKTKHSKLVGDKRDIYWKNEMDTHIDKYNKSESQEERDYIYTTYLQRPFRKMSEIYYVKVFKTEFNEELINSAISHSIVSMKTYDLAKGPSFSYLSFAFRNFYIQMWGKKLKKEGLEISMEDLSGTEHGEHPEVCEIGFIKPEQTLRSDELVAEFMDWLGKKSTKNTIRGFLKTKYNRRKQVINDDIGCIRSIIKCMGGEVNVKSRHRWNRLLNDISPLWLKHIESKGIDYKYE